VNSAAGEKGGYGKPPYGLLQSSSSYSSSYSYSAVEAADDEYDDEADASQFGRRVR